MCVHTAVCWWESRRLDTRVLRRQAPWGSRRYPRSHPQSCEARAKLTEFGDSAAKSGATWPQKDVKQTPSPAAQSSALGREQDSPAPWEEEGCLGQGPRPGFQALPAGPPWAALGKSLGLSEQPQSPQVRRTNSSFISPGFAGRNT